MIFVTVGTTAFEGLTKAADGLELKDEIIIQKADGKYLPQNKEFFEYSEKFDQYVDRAEVIVTHGGAGTLFKLINAGKRVVGVANEERTDLHQWDILKKLSDEGHIIWCQDLNKLGSYIEKAKTEKFMEYQPPKSRIAKEIIEKYVK